MSRHSSSIMRASGHLDASRHRAGPAGRGRLATPRRAGALPLGLEVLLGLCLVATPLAGLVIGWFAVSFQLFGETADAGDYRTATGAYVATAGVLVVGALAARGHRAPGWLVAWSLGWTALLLTVALSTLSDATAAARQAARDGETLQAVGGWQDGATAVLAGPWVWLVLVMAALAVVRRRR